MANPDAEKAQVSLIENGADIVIDTLHQDEAMKVLSTYTGDQTWTSKEEKSLRRKIDLRLMPILCATYGIQYYDKAMLSQAALFGLRPDLDLDVGERYSFSASIFYIGFIAGAYPAIVMAQRWPIERVAFGIVLVWGLCMALAAACQTWQGFFAQRFFLGMLEAGISPMFMLVVGQFYKKDEQALRMGIWYCCAGYASMFSPLINYGLGHISGALSPWKYMYIVAGSITIIWAIVVLVFLPPDPIRAKGFSERERCIALARLRSNNTGVRNTHFKTTQLWELLQDVRFWLMFTMSFLMMITNGPVSTFTPILVKSFGFNVLNSLLLTMPLGAVIGTLEWVLPYLAYRFNDNNIRCYLIVLAQMGTILAALLLWLLPLSATGGLLYGVYTLASTGAGYAVMMGLQIANTAGYTKRSLASSGMFVGYCLGNIVGPLVFRKQDAPRYRPGFAVVVTSASVAAVLAFVYRAICARENKKRDAAGHTESFEHAFEDDQTDMKNPQFRYIL